MHDFQKKRQNRKIMYSPITLGILSVLTLIILSGVWGVYNKAKLSAINLEREKSELVKLQIREKNLSSSIDYLKTDQGVENEIRTKFRAVKDGEKVVVIVDNKDNEIKKEEIASTTRGFWSKVFHWSY